MRVIAGAAKGRKLASVPGETTRPITDRVKEAVFNILGPDIRGARVLDLFGGTGGVGIEALSRGAESATFVEIEPRAVRVIKANLKSTGLAERGRVVGQDVFRFIPTCRKKYDLIYVAPPQYKGLWARALHELDEHDLLAEDGEIIVQIYPKEYSELELRSLAPTEERRYGSTLIVFFGRKERADETPSPD